METIQDMLIAWGKGAALWDAPNGYPSRSALVTMAGKGDIGVAGQSIGDHIRVDAEVSALRVKKPKHYIIVERCYRRGLSDTKIARRLKMSRSAVREMRIAAEYYLEARLID
jgi:ribosomal protein S14